MYLITSGNVDISFFLTVVILALTSVCGKLAKEGRAGGSIPPGCGYMWLFVAKAFAMITGITGLGAGASAPIASFLNALAQHMQLEQMRRENPRTIQLDIKNFSLRALRYSALVSLSTREFVFSITTKTTTDALDSIARRAMMMTTTKCRFASRAVNNEEETQSP